MINKNTKLFFIGLSLSVVIAITSIVTITAKAGDMEALNKAFVNFCANSYFTPKNYATAQAERARYVDYLSNSPYAKWQKTPNVIISEYHEFMNIQFNAYISRLMNNIDKLNDPNSVPPAQRKDGSMPQLCDANDKNDPENRDLKTCCSIDNYSTYCVALRLYSDPQYGYKAMSDVLNCRRYDLVQKVESNQIPKGLSSSIASLSSSHYNPFNLLTPNPTLDYANSQIQSAVAYDVAYRSKKIAEQITKAKEAFDQTLSAYDQLRLFWTLHIKYIDIYKNLVQYRDKMAKIRSRVESFPAKYIDASTTKCI